MIGTRPNQRGFALLVVLWTVALLALLATALVAASRGRLALTLDLRTAAALEAAADGATQHAIFEILKGHWTANESVRIGAVNVSISLEDEALRLNPNFASAEELQTLLQQLAVDRRLAATLAAAIVEWRTPGGAQPPAAANDGSTRNDPPPGTPFTRFAELAAVPGITPDIMQRLRSHLTLFAGTDPDLVPAGGAADAANAVRVTGIVAVAHGSHQAMFVRHIIVRTNARRSGRRYEVLMSDRDATTAEPHPGAELNRLSP